MRKLEILAPAGNLEIFKSNIDAGADAIYFGGEMFGARAYADNFSFLEAKEAIEYAHLRGKSAYLTVNTLLKNIEIERQLFDYLKPYYEIGLDAVIVQDFGVMNFIHDAFEDLAIHASTQMTIANRYGADFMKKCGANRIVTARELSLKEIKNISDNVDLEIETFVHGALCYAYSGQCLMSSLIGGRSGNRGRCAQPCRLPYHLLDNEFNEIKTKGEYLLSPKDLCGLKYVKDMADAGVYSFKIEGRMKNANYANGVVSVYRKYIDAYESGDFSSVSKNDEQKLLDFGNRSGFTSSYFFKHNDADMMSSKKSSFENNSAENVNICSKKISLICEFKAKLGEKMSIQLSLKDSGDLPEISVEKRGQIVEPAQKRAVLPSEILDKINKVGNTPFIFDDIDMDVDEDIFIPMSKLNELRRDAMEDIMSIILSKYNRSCLVSNKDILAKYHADKRDDGGNINIMVTVKDYEQLQEVILHNYIDSAVIDYNMLVFEDGKILDFQKIYAKIQDINEDLSEAGIKMVIGLPAVFRERSKKEMEALMKAIKDFDLLVLACSYDELDYLEINNILKRNIILDNRLYTFSNVALSSFENFGYKTFCAPIELNKAELSHRINNNSYISIYGRSCMMITANCQVNNSKGCTHIPELTYLQDRYKMDFPVRNVCGPCYNEIYNSKILNLISDIDEVKKMNFAGVRIDFTIEDKDQVKDVLQEVYSFCKTGNGREGVLTGNDYTKGHWKRGVE